MIIFRLFFKTAVLLCLCFSGLYSCSSVESPPSSPHTMPIAVAVTSSRCYVEGSPTVKTGGILKLSLKCPTSIVSASVWAIFETLKVLCFGSLNDEQEVLFGIPMEHPLGKTVINFVNASDEKLASFSVDIQANEYPSESLTVDKGHVRPTAPKVLKRIAEEYEEVMAIYHDFFPSQLWEQGFAWPIQSRIVSPFGSKRIYNGTLKSFHTGVDLKAAIGTPIYPSASGKVALSKELFYTGNTVIVHHGYGIVTLYAHLSKLSVKKGDFVTPSMQLGLSGMTGRVTGPHLHWQVVIHSVKVSPLDLIALMGVPVL